MHMISHEHVGMDGDGFFFTELFQVIEVELVVLISIEAGAAVITALEI